MFFAPTQAQKGQTRNLVRSEEKVVKKSLFIVMGAALLTWGCSQDAPTPSTSGTPVVTSTAAEAVETPSETAEAPVAIPEASPEASPEVKARAEELLAAREDGKFPYKELSEKENGPAFVHIALTSEDPKAVSGALQAIKNVYSADKAYKKTLKADESVDQAIIKGLKSDDPEVLHFALRSAGKALGEEPNEEVKTILIDYVNNHDHVAARHEALDALTSLDRYAEKPEIVDVFLKAMKDDAPVASLALFRSKYSLVSGDKGDEVKATLQELLKHEDPGVRGRAIDLIAQFSRDGDALILEKAEPMLKDKNPFVRASALDALSRVKDPKAVHLIMTLVDDTEKNTYDIRYENLLGKQDTVHHDGSAWSRVNDAALYALKSATYRLPEEERFIYDKIDYKKVDEDIAAQAKKAKAWYEGFKKKNPEG